MIRKDLNFCDQILEAVAILAKKLKTFIFIFSTLNLLFPKIFSLLYSTRGFPTIPDLLLF